MQRYWAIRRKLCELVTEAIEIGPYAVDPKASDELCGAAVKRASGSGDAVAVLEEILAARGVHLTEDSDGQWGWSGLRLRVEGFGTQPS
jgi:hypothetical protein